MTQVPLKTTDHLQVGDEVTHPFTDLPVTVKEVREIAYQNDRYDVFFESGPAALNKHGASLWQLA